MKILWNKTKNWLNTNNHLLWISIGSLIFMCMLAMYFIGPYEAERIGLGGINFFFNKFWPFMLIGITILFVFSKLSKKWIVRINWILGIIYLLMILKTIIDPTIIKGTARYVKLGTAYIDPFAMMLPPYIVLISHWLSKDKTNQIWITISTIFVTLFITLAALRAPYIFMVQVYMLLFVIMTFKARKNVPWTFYTIIGLLIVFAVLMLFVVWHFPHIHTRIMHMGHYYTSQISLHAITSSALIGNTTESLTSLSRLPNLTSDFVFTGMIAKFGMLMGVLILILYSCLIKGLSNIIQNTREEFNKILSTGVLGLVSIYTIVALLVAFGGLAIASHWPFIGFGGTMLITWCILFGFVLAMNEK